MFLFKRKENETLSGLVNYGYIKNPKMKNWMDKTINDVKTSIIYDGRVFLIEYFFTRELTEDELDIIFPKVMDRVKDLNNELDTNQMGPEFIEAYIDKKYVSNITAEKLNSLANMFFEIVRDEVNKL